MVSEVKDIKKDRWYPVANDLIGGWSVTNVDKPPSQLDHTKREFEVADFIDEDLARHIADLHNNWLDQQREAA